MASWKSGVLFLYFGILSANGSGRKACLIRHACFASAMRSPRAYLRMFPLAWKTNQNNNACTEGRCYMWTLYTASLADEFSFISTQHSSVGHLQSDVSDIEGDSCIQE